MKIYIQKLFRVFAPFIACFMPILCMAAPASAAVLQPFDYLTKMVGTEDGYLVTIDFPDNFQYWEYFSNDYHIGSNFGPSVTVDLQENEIDNAMFQVSLMGASGGYNRFETVYLTNDAQLKLDFTMSLRFSKAVSQSFDGTIGVRLAYYAANGNYIKTENVADIPFSCSNVVDNRDVIIFNGSQLFPVDRSVGAYFRYYLILDFTNIQNENVATQMTMTVTDNSVIQMPLSSLYVQQQQTGETNKILSQVEQQLHANGEKLDDIMNGSQADQDAANDFENNSSNQGGQLDDANDILNNVTKPDPGDIPMDVGDYIPPDGSRAFSDLLAPVYASPIMYTPLLIAVVFLVLRFVLFGKAR